MIYQILFLREAPKFNRIIIFYVEKNSIRNTFELLFSHIAGNADILVMAETYTSVLAERISHPALEAIMKFRNYPGVFAVRKGFNSQISISQVLMMF